jgi:hypothetical protein
MLRIDQCHRPADGDSLRLMRDSIEAMAISPRTTRRTNAFSPYSFFHRHFSHERVLAIMIENAYLFLYWAIILGADRQYTVRTSMQIRTHVLY